MTRYVFKMPDLGEGTVEAEVVAWHVKVGDLVKEDQVIAEVMTEKAAVEVPSPVTGRVVSLTGAAGRHGAGGRGTHRVRDRRRGRRAGGPRRPPRRTLPAGRDGSRLLRQSRADAIAAAAAARQRVAARRAKRSDGRVMASPATRRRAREAGIDLARASRAPGPSGRITRQDFEAALGGAAAPQAAAARGAGRRPRDAHRHRGDQGHRRAPRHRQPHDRGEAQHPALRLRRGSGRHGARVAAPAPERPPAGGRAVAHLPAVHRRGARAGARRAFPSATRTTTPSATCWSATTAVHLGVATQTPRRPQGAGRASRRGARRCWDLAAEIRRVSEAARAGKAAREELTGSTITITSLGKLGGIVSTPIINAPEMAIIGVNKAIERAGRRERRDHGPPHDESVLVLRSPLRGRLRRRRDDPGAQGPARAPRNDLHPRLDRCTPSNRDRQLQDSPRMSTNPQARPAFGTVLADQMAIATFSDGKWSAHEVRRDRADRDAPGGARAALRQHLLRGLQGLSLGGRQRARVPHGQAHRAHAPERAPARAAGAGRRAAREDDPDRDRPRAGAGARSRRARSTCGRCCSGPCRTSARPRSRRTRRR